jgi:hypothetical protein
LIAAGVMVLCGLVGASMRVARRRIDVSDGVKRPPFPRSRPPASRQGWRAGQVPASATRSRRRPAKILLVGPEMVQQHGELAGHRDACLLHADPLGQRAAPATQRARALQTASTYVVT